MQRFFTLMMLNDSDYDLETYNNYKYDDYAVANHCRNASN